MQMRQLGFLAATGVVFVWSVVMVALDHVAAIATLAPTLGLTVQQITHAARAQTIPTSGACIASLPEQEGEAP
ncbi:hypothetical protein [Streptomyces sp. NBC_00342]|uniref:hypothetical protein n=1 Tax=Streptomyces sp. NBC_00342 TaxID=2975718 RepID=UPI002E2E79E9|nr:hypothetical protein [Streptomyces sp. NBC_00342]